MSGPVRRGRGAATRDGRLRPPADGAAARPAAQVYREGARAAQRSTTHPEAAGLEALSALSDAELIAKISGPKGG